MQWLIVLASVTSWSFRTASSVSRSDAPHAFLSVVSQSPRDLGDWRWWLDSTASLRERREYGAHRIHPDFPIEGSLRRSASTAFCRDWIEWNQWSRFEIYFDGTFRICLLRFLRLFCSLIAISSRFSHNTVCFSPFPLINSARFNAARAFASTQ